MVSPFPLPFPWQKPMVGVSCALLTAVEFLPLASLSGTEIQGGSDLLTAASCKCSYFSARRSSFTSRSCPGKRGSRLQAECESYTSRSALLLEGCTEEGMLWQRLEIGFALGSSPGRLWLGSCSLLRLWLLAGNGLGKYSLGSFSLWAFRKGKQCRW